MSAEAVTLHRDGTTVVVQGGAWLTLSSWVVGGVERLASPDEVPADYRVHGARAGVTFLHPWANRVRADAFAVAGREVRVPAGSPRDPDGVAIHGEPGDWVPRAASDAACAVRRDVAATAAFPFAHRVAIEVRLEDDAVAVSTEVAAPDDGPLPVCFGWHPYFRLVRAREQTVLDLPGDRAPLGGRTFDDGLTAMGGVTWAVGDVALDQDEGYAFGQVFAPEDADLVSLEPMTAPADALRTGEGLRVLTPGERFAATFRLRA